MGERSLLRILVKRMLPFTEPLQQLLKRYFLCRFAEQFLVETFGPLLVPLADT